ncbi:hypothetical protein BJX64DRAFT_287993 [Aspergillus heterothallicus]
MRGLPVLGVISVALAQQPEDQTWKVNKIRETAYLQGGSLWWQIWYDDGSVSQMSQYDNSSIIYTLNLSASFNTATTNLSSLFGTITAAGALAYFPLTDTVGNPTDTILGYERYPRGSETDEWIPRFNNVSLGNITRYVTHGAGISVPSENLGFYVRGLRALDWGPIWDNGSATNISHNVITVNMSDENQTTWSNITLPEDIPGRAGAGAAWIPISQSGIILLIGGVTALESIYGAGLTEEQEAESIRASGGGQVDSRSGHECIRHYPDQMLVLGGSRPAAIDCIEIIRVFNLNTGMFQESYDTVGWSDYQVPVLVAGRIGGDSSGGATRTSPISWTNTSLRDNTTSQGSGGSGFPGWTGGLIGGIIGAFVIVGLLIFWLIRNHRQSATDAQAQEMPPGKPVFSDGPVELLAPTPPEAASQPIFEIHDRSQTEPAELPVANS